MPWVTDSKRKKRGVHKIPPGDFNPEFHKLADPPIEDSAPELPAGDGRPQVSVQEEAEAASNGADAVEIGGEAEAEQPSSDQAGDEPADSPRPKKRGR